MQKPVRRDKVRDASTPIVPKAMVAIFSQHASG